MMKLCPCCKETKPFEMFNKDSKRKSGLQVYCKACKLNMQRANPNRKASVDKYRNANREVCNERTKASQAKKRDYYSIKTMEWMVKNSDRNLKNRRKNYAFNSAKEIARVRRRKGRIKHGELMMSQAEMAEVQGLYDFCRIFKGFEVDHKIPLNGEFVSGLHVLGNLQVLPVGINRSKGNKFPINP